MILIGSKKFRKVSFDSEEEIEKVVRDYYKLLFGEHSIYLPQQYIKTVGGIGSVPDAFALNFKEEVWYIVEVELAKHGVWQHIAQQVTKQIVATKNIETKLKLIDIFTKEVEKSDELKRKFDEIGISEIGIRKKIQEIIMEEPTVAIPIDYISDDLKDWIDVLRNKAIILEIEKFVDEETQEIAYKISEYLPTPFVEEEDRKRIITEEEFIKKCEEPARVLFEELKRIAAEKKYGDELVPRRYSFSYRVKLDSKEISLLTVYPDSVYIMKYNLREENFKPEAVETFAKKVKKISLLSERYDTMPQPGFSTRSVTTSVDDIKIFIEAFKELLNGLKKVIM